MLSRASVAAAVFALRCSAESLNDQSTLVQSTVKSELDLGLAAAGVGGYTLKRVASEGSSAVTVTSGTCGEDGECYAEWGDIVTSIMTGSVDASPTLGDHIA